MRRLHAVAKPPRGLSCKLRKAYPQSILSRMARAAFLGFPTAPDNPRAFGAAPSFKGEYLATTGSYNSFTVPLPKEVYSPTARMTG